MHQIIYKIPPQYDGWIALTSLRLMDNFFQTFFVYSVMKGIKNTSLVQPEFILNLSFYKFDFSDLNQYTLDDILQMKNESQNIHFCG